VTLLSRNQRLVRNLVPGDVLDIAAYCGPGLDCRGVRVTALPHSSGETTEVTLDGKRTAADLWRVPAVCASCGASYFKQDLADNPVHLLQSEAGRRD
jgi:hypothetical protein